MSGFDNEVVYADGIDLTNNRGSISNQLATDGFIYFGNSGGRPQAALPTSSDGTVTFTAGNGSLDMSVTNPVISWIEETTTTRALIVNQGVIGNNASTITMTLPDTAAVGSIIRIVGKGLGKWKIAQNASEIIHFGTSTTTTGITGSLESTQVNDAIEMVCLVADTEWAVLSSIGNITVV